MDETPYQYEARTNVSALKRMYHLMWRCVSSSDMDAMVARMMQEPDGPMPEYHIGARLRFFLFAAADLLRKYGSLQHAAVMTELYALSMPSYADEDMDDDGFTEPLEPRDMNARDMLIYALLVFPHAPLADRLAKIEQHRETLRIKIRVR